MEIKKAVKITGFAVVIVLVLIIIFWILMKFYPFNKPQSSFEVNAVFLKTSISESETSESTVKIINTDSRTRSFSITMKNMDNLSSIEEKEFSLEPKEEKNIKINFKPEKGKTEIYLGQLYINSENEIKEIPIVVEVHSKEVLFYGTLSLYPPQDNVPIDSKINSEIKIYDLSIIGKNSVEVSYFITDFEGNNVISESENLVVDKKLEYSKTFDLSGIKTGDYVLGMKVKYRDSTGISSIPFKIKDKKSTSGLNSQYITFFIIVFALIVMIILIIKFGMYIFETKIKPFENLDKDIADKRSFIYKNIEKKVELRKKLETLEKAFSSGYITQDSYSKGIERLKKLLDE